MGNVEVCRESYRQTEQVDGWMERPKTVGFQYLIFGHLKIHMFMEQSAPSDANKDRHGYEQTDSWTDGQTQNIMSPITLIVGH